MKFCSEIIIIWPVQPSRSEFAKKWYFEGFGLAQMTCPKSGQKVVLGLPRWHAQKVVKKLFWACPDDMPQNCQKMLFVLKVDAAAEGRHLYLSKAQAKLVFLWSQILLGPFFDNVLGTFWPLFGHVIWASLKPCFHLLNTLGRVFLWPQVLLRPFFDYSWILFWSFCGKFYFWGL